MVVLFSSRPFPWFGIKTFLSQLLRNSCAGNKESDPWVQDESMKLSTACTTLFVAVKIAAATEAIVNEVLAETVSLLALAEISVLMIDVPACTNSWTTVVLGVPASSFAASNRRMNLEKVYYTNLYTRALRLSKLISSSMSVAELWCGPTGACSNMLGWSCWGCWRGNRRKGGWCWQAPPAAT